MTAVAANAHLTGDDLAAALRVFNTIGSTTTLAEDHPASSARWPGVHQPTRFLHRQSGAGVKHGLSKDQATQIAAQATLGSAKMVLESDKIPFALIDQVASPGGSTVARLFAMEEAGLMTAVVKGIDANIARRRRSSLKHLVLVVRSRRRAQGPAVDRFQPEGRASTSTLSLKSGLKGCPML